MPHGNGSGSLRRRPRQRKAVSASSFPDSIRVLARFAGTEARSRFDAAMPSDSHAPAANSAAVENPIAAERDVSEKQKEKRGENKKSRAERGKFLQLDREENSSRKKADGEEGRQLHARRLSRTNTSI